MQSTSFIREGLALILILVHIILTIVFFDPVFSPGFFIILATLILASITVIQKKTNTYIKAGSYVIIVGSVLALIMITTGEGTGNLEGWEFIFGEGMMLIAEMIAIILYLLGLLKKYSPNL